MNRFYSDLYLAKKPGTSRIIYISTSNTPTCSCQYWVNSEPINIKFNKIPAHLYKIGFISDINKYKRALNIQTCISPIDNDISILCDVATTCELPSHVNKNQYSNTECVEVDIS